MPTDDGSPPGSDPSRSAGEARPIRDSTDSWDLQISFFAIFFKNLAIFWWARSQGVHYADLGKSFLTHIYYCYSYYYVVSLNHRDVWYHPATQFR